MITLIIEKKIVGRIGVGTVEGGVSSLQIKQPYLKLSFIMKTIKFLFFSFLAIFGIIYVLILSYVYFNQADMVFRSSILDHDYKFEFEQNFEEINISSFDGTALHGVLFKAEKPKGLIFYLHGNKGTVAYWGNMAPQYTNLGYDIFILDYRGFGKSGGEIETEDQVYKDISAAYKHLLTRYEESKIIITGYSIGTGLAAYLAATNNPKALILQAPYYNFLEFSSRIVPYVPDFIKKFKFETNVFMIKIKAPIYIFHGKDDQLIGIENSVRLSKLLKPTDKLFPLDNQEHIGINENKDFLKELEKILK